MSDLDLDQEIDQLFNGLGDISPKQIKALTLRHTAEVLERVRQSATDEYDSDPKKVLTLGSYYADAIAAELAALRGEVK